jgi:hypothetical protein
LKLKLKNIESAYRQKQLKFIRFCLPSGKGAGLRAQPRRWDALSERQTDPERRAKQLQHDPIQCMVIKCKIDTHPLILS